MGVPLTRSHCVFVTFREGDPPTDGRPQPGLISDTLREANVPVLRGGMAERIDHHLALCYASTKIEHLAILCYDKGDFTNYRIPVAPDGGDHPYFRPVSPGVNPPYGKTRPDLYEPDCPLGPQCVENELVHENRPLTADRVWITVVRGESTR